MCQAIGGDYSPRRHAQPSRLPEHTDLIVRVRQKGIRRFDFPIRILLMLRDRWALDKWLVAASI